jgi:[ribosomal protein S5]-alanine N-acetyltransferase
VKKVLRSAPPPPTLLTVTIVDPLLTPRLRLVPVTSAIIDAADRSRAQLEALVGSRIHDEWRGAHVLDRGRLALLDSAPRHALVIHRADDVVIGEVRYERQRAGQGVEIGYGIVPSYRRQGFAVEATAAVIATLETQGVAPIIAGCAMKNVASVRTLRRLGFTLDGSTARGSAFWWVRLKGA